MPGQSAHVDTVAGFLAGTCRRGALAEPHSAAALINTTADDPSRDACDGTAVRPESHRPTRAAGGAARSDARRVLTLVRRSDPLTARAIWRWSHSTLEAPSAASSPAASSSVVFASATILVAPLLRPRRIILVAKPGSGGSGGSGGRRDHDARPVRGCHHQRRPEVAHTASDSSSRGCIDSTMSTPSKLSSTAAYVVAHEARPRTRVNDSATAKGRTQTCRYRNALTALSVVRCQRVALLASRPYVDGVCKPVSPHVGPSA